MGDVYTMEDLETSKRVVRESFPNVPEELWRIPQPMAVVAGIPVEKYKEYTGLELDKDAKCTAGESSMFKSNGEVDYILFVCIQENGKLLGHKSQPYSAPAFWEVVTKAIARCTEPDFIEESKGDGEDDIGDFLADETIRGQQLDLAALSEIMEEKYGGEFERVDDEEQG